MPTACILCFAGGVGVTKPLWLRNVAKVGMFTGRRSGQALSRGAYSVQDAASNRTACTYMRASQNLNSSNEANAESDQWEELILEFEERNAVARADAEARAKAARPYEENLPDLTPPTGRLLGRENPAVYESLPVVEAAMMTAATGVLWWLGRMLRLDSLLTLFYPLPAFYVMMRWGPYYGNITVFTSAVFIFALMGPLFGITFALNTALLSFAFGNAFWRQWNWALTLLAGATAKSVGLMLQLAITSALLRENAWKFIGEQVKDLIDSMGGTLFKILRWGAFSGPTMRQVNIGVTIILALHATFHVVFTHLATTMILDRMFDAGQLKRTPKLVPFLNWLKARVNRGYDEINKYRKYSKRNEPEDKRKDER